MIPLTSSGVAVRLFKKTLHERGTDFQEVFGTGFRSTTFWNEKTGKLVTVKQDQPVPMRAAFADFVTQTAHGGRGECFYAGPTPIGTYYDIDIASAYTTVLSMLGLVDYAHPRVLLDPEAFRGHVLGFALVDSSAARTRSAIRSSRWRATGRTCCSSARGCVPRTEEVMTLFALLQAEFPGAELDRLLAWVLEGAGGSSAAVGESC